MGERGLGRIAKRQKWEVVENRDWLRTKGTRLIEKEEEDL